MDAVHFQGGRAMARSWLTATTALILLIPSLNAADDPLPEHALRRLGSQHWRHGATVIALAFTPDGKQLISAGQDGVIRLWDSTTGRQIRILESNRGPIRAFALSPDGKTFASISKGDEVRLREVANGRLVRKFELKAASDSVAFSPDGKQLAAGEEQNVKVWETETGRVVQTIPVETAARQLHFTHDRKHLCVSGADGTGVNVFTLDGGKLIQRLSGWPGSICLAGEGSLLSSDQDKVTLSLYDLKTGKLRFDLKDRDGGEQRAFRAHVASEKGVIVSGCWEGYVRGFKVETGQILWSQFAHPAGVKALALTADGKVAATADMDGMILLWNTARGQSLNEPSHSRGAVLSAALSPNGESAVLVDRAGRARVYSTKDGSDQKKESPELPRFRNESFSSAACSPDGQTLALGRSNGEVILHELRSGKEKLSLEEAGRAITRLLFSPDGKTLLSAGQDRRIRQWDTATGKPGLVVGGLDRQPCLAFAISGDGEKLFVADGAASPYLLDRQSGRTLLELPGHQGGCLAVALAPSGRVAVSGGRDGLIRFWETARGAERRTLPGGGWVHCLACTSDGGLLASGHDDGKVHVWDMRSGLRLRTCEGHRGAVLALDFSKDGKRLLSAGIDSTAVVWDTSLERLRPEPLKLNATQTAVLWEQLASTDGMTGSEAIQSLARGGDQTIALLREKVRPVTEAELTGLIHDLDAKRFAARDRAVKRLTSLGRFVEPRLREELTMKPPLEVRRRIEDILNVITREQRPIEELRLLRALEVLEMLGTPAAKAILKELASGASGCELTSEAKGVLDRLGK
jgi:WD40 repeat protein